MNGYNPIFVTSTFPTSFDFTVDLHFRSTSPGINAGTDGTDIGIYGNAYSLAFPDYTGEPQLPAFRSFDLKNPVVGASGQLRFNIHAIKKD